MRVYLAIHPFQLSVILPYFAIGLDGYGIRKVTAIGTPLLYSTRRKMGSGNLDKLTSVSGIMNRGDWI